MVYCWGKAEETEEEERQKVMMPWWDKKVVCPVKRAWVAIAARVKACKHGDGILKLHDDVQTCGYEDVQVMWEIVRRSEAEGSNASEQRKRRLGGHQPALPDERPPVTPRSCINITTTIELEEVGGFEQRAAVAALPPSSSSSCCA
ncbi:hypothetical protein MUK42_08858 [Musa troglodytarum]|uniref:Uncharacterized protein n=1 Tax=Musa troglodytarum TaxID=320322 RepID=A0A9E7JBQ6_9LILI|nr:hypothetical protein MUK42_08858 [Musa troglodytarum]